MEKQIHGNYIKSSNLVFGTVLLGLINFIFSGEQLSNGQNIATAIITLLLIVGIGFLVRQGKVWVKYLLLILTVLGIIVMSLMPYSLDQKLIIIIIDVAQTIMQIWATILLFRIPKADVKK